MQLAQSAEACSLSGLSPHQLREWCIRRGIVAPDVPPAGPGRHALYSWQTLLVLRLLRDLHERFAVEVGAWAAAMTSLQQQLQGRPFPALWGLGVQFPNAKKAILIRQDLITVEQSPGLQLALDPHLTVLAAGLTLPGPPSQPSLFPAIVVQR
jgi:hypothetical protein